MSPGSKRRVEAARGGPHWREYLIEAWGLGTFMVSACVFATLLEHPASPIREAIAADGVRRAIMGAAMGLTAMAIVYSPWGRRSGAHLNPAFTLTFFRLGRVAPRDMVFYPLAQFAGAVAGVVLSAGLLGMALAEPRVHYVTTRPGAGVAAAFVAEAAISMLLMAMVLTTAVHTRLSRWTGLFAGTMVALYITFEAPISGMSMNPARTFGSAFVARDWTALWLYFSAPVLGMLGAAQLYLGLRGRRSVPCAKMRHAEPCIFCEYAGPAGTP